MAATTSASAASVSSQTAPELQVERNLNAKLVPSPKKLLEELRRELGPYEYYHVEMRHNVYKIRASTDFDLQRLIRNCDLDPSQSHWYAI